MIRAFVHYGGGAGTVVPNSEVPQGLDWDMYCGPSPLIPYHPHRCHGSFRGYWNFDQGGLGEDRDDLFADQHLAVDPDALCDGELQLSQRSQSKGRRGKPGAPPFPFVSSEVETLIVGVCFRGISTSLDANGIR